MGKLNVKRGVSQAVEAKTAVAELYQQLQQEQIKLLVFFCSPHYNLNDLSQALVEFFPDTQVIGCTTAGEITPLGYLSGSLTGVSIASPHFTAKISCIDSLSHAHLSEISLPISALTAEMTNYPSQELFAFLLIDGLSVLEETVVSTIYHSLGNIPLFGGSAGDGLDFQHTFIYYQGEFRQDRVLLTLIHTTHPFKVFRTAHFVPTDKRMVITEADTKRRIVHEVNGLPAVEEYARLVGVEVNELNPMMFATYPVLVKIGNNYYVRSVSKVNEDGGLSFFCAIDIGVVMTIAKRVDIVSDLRQLFEDIHQEIGQPALIFGCDCILRNLELDRFQLKEKVGKMMVDNHVIGFSTYGEQFNNMHVNQTFTGIAIGNSS
jgi:hypothetical protein